MEEITGETHSTFEKYFFTEIKITVQVIASSGKFFRGLPGKKNVYAFLS